MVAGRRVIYNGKIWWFHRWIYASDEPVMALLENDEGKTELAHHFEIKFKTPMKDLIEQSIANSVLAIMPSGSNDPSKMN
jgi:hypothetical protein